MASGADGKSYIIDINPNEFGSDCFGSKKNRVFPKMATNGFAFPLLTSSCIHKMQVENFGMALVGQNPPFVVF